MSLNPIALVRDMSSNPNLGRGSQLITGRMTGGAGGTTLVVETRLKTIVSAFAVKENSTTAVPVIAVANSTAYPGTQKVTFTLAASGVYSWMIIGLVDRTSDAVTGAAGGTTTVTYNPVTGDYSQA